MPDLPMLVLPSSLENLSDAELAELAGSAWVEVLELVGDTAGREC